MSQSDPVRAHLLDESVEFSLTELCDACGLPEQLIVEIVEEGVVEPSGGEPVQWRFTGIAVTRIQRVLRLQQEFEVNLAGAALALELLDEIERLRRRGR
jgi:chaperone modulatory protein CbpM